MPWHRIDRFHWQNHNDRHIFFDDLRKTISAETWAEEKGHVAIVIPIDDLASLLKENRYHTYPEVILTDILEDKERSLTETENLYLEKESLDEKIHHLSKSKKKLAEKAYSAGKIATMAEDAYNKALTQIEYDGQQIIKLKKEKAELELQVQQEKQANLALVAVSQKEIDGLRRRVKELENK